MWVIFTAHCDNSKKVKMTTRYCESHKIAVLVSEAFLNKLTADGYSFDFVSWDFCHYNAFNDYSEIVTLEDVNKAITSNPCDYGRCNDIGLNRLHLYL